MGTLKYRKDNKRVLSGIYALFILAIIGSLVINVLNTKNVRNMYIILLVFGSLILLYLLFYPIFIFKNKELIQLEENSLAFYVSFNRRNKFIKKCMFAIDEVELFFICGVAAFYIIKMKFYEVYGLYSLIGLTTLVLSNSFIAVRDFIKIKSFDRIDAQITSHQFSVIDKKVLFASILIIVGLANVGILSVTKPHFVIHFIDMVSFEILSTFLLLLSLVSIFITKLYYSHFDLKKAKPVKRNRIEESDI